MRQRGLPRAATGQSLPGEIASIGLQKDLKAGDKGPGVDWAKGVKRREKAERPQLGRLLGPRAAFGASLGISFRLWKETRPGEQVGNPESFLVLSF